MQVHYHVLLSRTDQTTLNLKAAKIVGHITMLVHYKKRQIKVKEHYLISRTWRTRRVSKRNKSPFLSRVVMKTVKFIRYYSEEIGSSSKSTSILNKWPFERVSASLKFERTKKRWKAIIEDTMPFSNKLSLFLRRWWLAKSP